MINYFLAVDLTKQKKTKTLHITKRKKNKIKSHGKITQSLQDSKTV